MPLESQTVVLNASADPVSTERTQAEAATAKKAAGPLFLVFVIEFIEGFCKCFRAGFGSMSVSQPFSELRASFRRPQRSRKGLRESMKEGRGTHRLFPGFPSSGL